MGVEARIVLYAPDEERAAEAARAAFARIARVEDALSDYRETSEVSRLRSGGRFTVSDDLWFALERSLYFARESGGAFDATAGELYRLWREARHAGVPPQDDAILHALASTASRRRDPKPLISLGAEGGTVRLLAGLRLDFGGIGQGIAADRALATLREHGIERALVDMSGDIALGDPPPGSDGWTIDAGCGEHTSERLVLARRGVSTSGDSEQHLEQDGVRYSHVIDPRSGQAVTNALCCTVIAQDATTADALATSVSVLGKDAGEALVARFPAARLIVDDPRTIALFDGKTLDGWVTKGGRYDGNASWTVEDGCITGRVNEKGEGGLLYTAKPYTSFDLELDVKMDFPFDSGIFVRMAPEGRGAQVTLDWRADGEVGAIYSDEFLQHNTSAKSTFKKDAWNHVRVRCTGFDMHLEVWLNGEKITDYQLPEASKGFAPTGLIGLQVHGDRDDPRENKVQFRNIRLRALSMFGEDVLGGDARTGAQLTEAAAKSGWKSLLARDSLDGWEPVSEAFGGAGSSNGYAVRDGVLSIPARGSGYLRTRDDFADFRLHMDFQLAEMTNSGLFLRGTRDGKNPAYSGCEVQILDDFNWETATKSKLEPTQFTGSLYASVAPGTKGVLRPIGEWNTYEVLYKGSRLAVALNGVTLYDVDTREVPGEPPFAERAKTGFIGLQRYGSPDVKSDVALRVRNLFVQRL